jgi:hypothetical protein
MFCTDCGAAIPPRRRRRRRLVGPGTIKKAAAVDPQNVKVDLDTARGTHPFYWTHADSGTILFSGPASEEICQAHKVSAEIGQAFWLKALGVDLPGFRHWITAPLVTSLAAFVAAPDRISWVRLRASSTDETVYRSAAGEDERFVGLGSGGRHWALAARRKGGEELHLDINSGESDRFMRLGTVYGHFDPNEAVWLGGSTCDVRGGEASDEEPPFDYVPWGEEWCHGLSTVWIQCGRWLLTINPEKRGIVFASTVTDRGPPLRLHERMRNRLVEPLSVDRSNNTCGLYLTAIREQNLKLGYIAITQANNFAAIRDIDSQVHISQASGEATAVVTSVGRVDLYNGSQRLHSWERDILTSAFRPAAGDGWLAALVPLEPGTDTPPDKQGNIRPGCHLHVFACNPNGFEIHATRVPIAGRTSNGLPPLLVDDSLVLMTTEERSGGEEVYLIAIPILSRAAESPAA